MTEIESPRISRTTEDPNLLPSYLKNVQGKLIIDSDYAIEGARLGPYDMVMDFGTSRSALRGLVPEEERQTSNTGDLTVLSFKEPMVRQAMEVITNIANNPTKSPQDPENRCDYRGHLARVYKSMAEEVINWGGADALIFSPKNGGIFVQEVFEHNGMPASNFFDYRMSRVQKKDGGLMVGVTAEKDNPEIADYRRFVFADDCLASEISAFGTLEMIKEKLEVAGVPLSEAEILITVSAATQRGVESLLSQSTAEYFGFGNIKIVTGILVYQMNDHFYLQHPDGRYVVGDMGEWTKSVA